MIIYLEIRVSADQLVNFYALKVYYSYYYACIRSIWPVEEYKYYIFMKMLERNQQQIV